MAERKRAVSRLKGAALSDDHTTAAAGVGIENLAGDAIRALDELGESGSAVVIERQNDVNPGQWDYLTRFVAAEFAIEKVKELYGGGNYRARVLDSDAGALNPVPFSIDKRFKGKGDVSPSGTAPVATATDPFRDKLLEVLLLKVLSPAPAPVANGPDPLALVDRIAGIFQKAQPNPVPVAPQPSFTDMLGLLQTGIAMGKDQIPAEGIGAAISQFAPVFKELIARAPRTATVNMERTVPSAVVTPTTAVIHQHNEPESNAVAGSIIPDWLRQFVGYRGMLLKLADSGRDATLYADVIFDNMEEDTATAFLAADTAGQVEVDVFNAIPELNATPGRRIFVGELLKGLRAAFAESAEEETTDTTGQVSNA